MNIRNLAAAAAALTLAASPAVAQADRSSEPAGDTEEMNGRGSGLILAILAIAAIIAAIVIAVDDDSVSA